MPSQLLLLTAVANHDIPILRSLVETWSARCPEHAFHMPIDGVPHETIGWLEKQRVVTHPVPLPRVRRLTGWCKAVEKQKLLLRGGSGVLELIDRTLGLPDLRIARRRTARLDARDTVLQRPLHPVRGLVHQHNRVPGLAERVRLA